MSDRMIVMAEGHVSGRLESDELRKVEEEQVLRLASTVYYDENQKEVV